MIDRDNADVQELTKIALTELGSTAKPKVIIPTKISGPVNK